MRTPMWGAALNAATNIAVSLLLFPAYGPTGIAVATSIAGWVNTIFLAAMLWRRALFRPSAETARRIALVLVATAATGGFLYFVRMQLGNRMLDAWIGERLLLVLGAIGFSMLLYFGLALTIGAIDRAQLMALLRRRRPKAPGNGEGA
jgi:putative peptidoglycan lipid II flippase